MRKALLALMCMVAMMATGTNLKAQEVTIVLMPGWTWISIPSTDTLDFATALGSFTPMAGDVIKSQWGNAFYRDGQWRGNISLFYPGHGYHYYSSRTMPVFLTFNAQQPAPQVVVTTSEPMLITGNSAMGGGEVTVSDGTYILVKGLCWATHENPTTNDDFYQEAESGVGTFSLSMTGLNISTTYYVRAYAVTGNGTVYGDQKTFTTRDGIPSLTTTDITNNTGASATSGGNITDNGGLNITVRGVCWSTLPNPTIADSHTTNGSGSGSFSSYMTGLSFSTTYYVRAYATNSHVTVYGNQIVFNSSEGYIDLGLPSGTLWATCNVGAEYPEAYGDYFAWGETQLKDTYAWSTYQYANGTSFMDTQLTKYCNNSSYGYNGFTDNLITLLPEDDAATANWGSDWRMPTQAEWQELLDNTTVTWTTQNGVSGRLFTASNGNSLFLPAAGYRDYSGLNWPGSSGYFWSSSLHTDYPHCAWTLYFGSGVYRMDFENRPCGLSVRPVRSLGQNASFVIDATANPAEGGVISGGGSYFEGTECTLTATPNEGYTFTNWTENGEVVSIDAIYTFTVNADRSLVANFTYNGGGSDHEYVDLGLPSGLLWATCNVGAIFPEDYGYYFAWGETQPKGDFTYMWSTYQHCNGSYNTLTKYCNNSDYGYNGFIDNLTILQPEDDAATANWGVEWRMPTEAEWGELFNNTTCTWTTQNGINGVLFTASNGNSLFLPAAGGRFGGGLDPGGSQGEYWTSTLNTWSTPNKAYGFSFDSYGNYSTWEGENRSCGISIRAVRSTQPITPEYSITITSSPLGGGIVTGGGTYQQGQSCTVSATAATGYTFTNWTENGSVVSTNANYTFTVNSNRTLVAHFSAQAPNTYTISVSSNPTNGGSVTGGGTYQQGQSCTVIAAAATGYTFTNWTENGSVVSTNAIYTFTVTSNKTLVAQFQSNVTIPTVTTAQVTNIASTTAVGGGNVTSSGGATVTERGICWSTGHNPTTSSNHASSGTGTGSFTVSLTSLTANTTYYVRTYAINNVGTAYGNEVSFTTLNNSGNHEYVDLGLPSGLLWATCNVGADVPEDYGDYFAWGEIQPKSTYNWCTYQYCSMCNSWTLNKYCSDPSYGYNGFTDNLTTLLPGDDAATANWGSSWRMPTQAEFLELLNNTTVTWTTQNGVNGRLFTGSNGNSLFLPAAGAHQVGGLLNAGSIGRYWSSSLCADHQDGAKELSFGSDHCRAEYCSNRSGGRSVRPVRSSQN